MTSKAFGLRAKVVMIGSCLLLQVFVLSRYFGGELQSAPPPTPQELDHAAF